MTDPQEVAVLPAAADERQLVEALRDGDEAAFGRLIREYGPAMLHVARHYVSSRAVAEEVVQEAWLGVLRGLATFQGRSSLKTLIFRVLTNTAISRGEREGRTVPFSTLEAGEEEEGFEPAVEQRRFTAEGRWSGHRSSPPQSWSAPEDRLLAGEMRDIVDRAISSSLEHRRS